MPNVAYLTANSYWGCAVETTYGTPASVSTFTPIDSPKISPTLTWLHDTAFRGSPVMNYDEVPGVRHDTFDGKTYMYSDVYPNLIRAALGSSDTVASVGPSLWTHTIGLNNQPNLGSQAPSYTIINDSVDNTYNMTGSRMVNMSVGFNADAAVETTFQFQGNAASVVASVAVNESTQHIIPAWNCAASLGGAAISVVESATLDIKRNTSAIHTLGQQQPYLNYQGAIEVSGSLGFVLIAGSTLWANALVRDQQQLLLNFVDPVTNYAILFQMSTIQLEDPIIDQSKNYITVQSKFTAVANATDVTTMGLSPIKAVATNGVSTAY